MTARLTLDVIAREDKDAEAFQSFGPQLELNRAKNLLHSRAEQLLEVDPTFIAALEELIVSPPDVAGRLKVDEMVAEAADCLVEKIQAINPYIQVDSQAKDTLAGIYVDSRRRLVQTREIEGTLRTHHSPKIRRFLENLYPEGLREALRSATELGQVPSSEYSAELQMRLLRLDPSRIKEPILDLGCGRKAYLVRELRARNLEAHGIDRHAANSGGFVTNADWFDFHLGHARWGTIVAHLSFTNPMVYCQRYDFRNSARYEKRYVEILDALKLGGSFVYTPGVQSIEDRVAKERTKVTNWPLSAQITATTITKVSL